MIDLHVLVKQQVKSVFKIIFILYGGTGGLFIEGLTLDQSVDLVCSMGP